MGAPASEAFKALGRSRPSWLLTLSWGLLGFAGWAVVQWLPAVLARTLPARQAHAGIYATAFTQVAAFCGVPFGARRRIAGAARICEAASVPMIALTLYAPAVSVLSQTEMLLLAIGCLVVYGYSPAAHRTPI